MYSVGIIICLASFDELYPVFCEQYAELCFTVDTLPYIQGF